MNNEAKYTPENILGYYRIPLYQRLFAWGINEVNKLLYDLKEHFASDRFKKEHNPYYLGLLTTIKHNGYIDLIDGQQRFTVIMLLAIAFKDYYKMNEEWMLFLDNGKRLRLAARPEDEQYLTALAKGEKTNKYENVYMRDALGCIKNFMKKEFPDDDSRKEFAHNAYKYLTFFVSELPAHYLKEPTSLNKYFEVMNSTGKGLEQHNILKVKLLKNQSNSYKLLKIWNVVSKMNQPVLRRNDDVKDEEYAEMYRQALSECRTRKYENVLSRIQESIDDSQEEAATIDVIQIKKKENRTDIHHTEREDCIISFQEFLLLTLDLTNECDGKDGFYQKDKLLERFECNLPTNIEVFYNNMLFYRLLLDYYVVKRDISNGQSRFTIYFRDNEKQGYPKNLIQYLSMLTVSTAFYVWLKPYMKYLINSQDDYKKASEILAYLKKSDNERRKNNGYPERLRIEKYPNIDRYWFWRLDYYLWEHRMELFNNEKDRKAVDEYVFRTNRSIEHLHPQNESYNELWENGVNGFGNLAMISQSFNSQQSNDNVRVKFARIHEQIDNKSLQSIKMLMMYRKANKDESKWSEELAKEHGDEMCEILEQSFEDAIR